MKKSILVFTGLMGLFGGLTLASCTNDKEVVNTPKEVVSFNTMYTSSAITGINALNTNVATKRMALANKAEEKKALTDAEKEAVIKNYELLEGLLSDDITSTDPVKPEANDPHSEYEFTYTVSIKNLDGTTDSYVFYYDELTEEEYNKKDEEKVKKAAENKDEEPKQEESKPEEEETETESHLKGIVIMNDKEYEMKGAKEIEVSGEETETELTYEILDPETKEKIVMVEESETETEDGKTENENEFSIKRYNADGKEIYKKKISIEADEAGELEYSVKETINGVKSKIKFEILTDADGSKFVEAKITENDQIIKAEFKVVVLENGQVDYVFEEEANK